MIRWIVRAFIVAILYGLGHANSPRVINTNIEASLSDNTNVDFIAFANIVNDHRLKSSPLFEEYYDSLLRLSLKSKNPADYAICLNIRANELILKGQNIQAFCILDEANKIIGKHGSLQMRGAHLNRFGLVHTLIGNYDLGLKYFLKSAQLKEMAGDPEGMVTVMGNIGLAQYKLRDNEAAIQYYKKALRYANLTDSARCANLNINIGLAFSEIQQFDSAFHYLGQASLCYPEIREQSQIAGSFHFAEAKIFLETGRLKKAEEVFLRAFHHALKAGDLRHQAECQVYLARVYLKKRSFSKARTALQFSHKIAAENGLNEIVLDVFRQQAVLAKEQNRIDEQVYWEERYINLSNELYDERLFSRISAHEAEMNAWKDKEKIAEQQQILVLQKESISKRNQLIILLVLFVFLIVILIRILRWASRRRQLRNVELESLVKERTKHIEKQYLQTATRLNEQRLTAKTMRSNVVSLIATLEGFMQIASPSRNESIVSAVKRLREICQELDGIERLPAE